MPFERTDLEQATKELNLPAPKNLGDALYAIRYRISLPDEIARTQPPGMEWIIEGTGRASYAFVLVPINRILPRSDLLAIPIPDATPEIIRLYALDDEQALLAVVRYNRLVDIFLGLTTFSLQNHLRTTVKSIGQIEIDELYVGVDRHGCHFAIPVQAKGGSDKISVVQTRQDIYWCQRRFPGMRVRALSAQFMSEERIALFELVIDEDSVKVLEERHYRLVKVQDFDHDAATRYR